MLKNNKYLQHPNINYFDPTKGWSSGPTALWFASTFNPTEIYILGFDYVGVDNNTKFNNVYASTPNYKRSHEPPTYCGNWLKQTETTIKTFKEVKYIRVINSGDYIANWNYSNLEHINYQEFKKRVKYQND